MKNFGFLNDRKTILLAVFACIGLMMVLCAAAFSNTEKSDIPTTDKDIEEYVTNLESRLESVISEIEGAGKTNVFISVENTFETVYANNSSIDQIKDNQNESRTTQRELAYLSSKTEGEKPIVVKQISPKIGGVLVVCQGADTISVKKEIINSVSIAFDIATNKIYVTGGEK